MIDFRRGEEVEAAAVLERLLEWTEPARSALGIEVDLPEANGAQRARAALGEGAPIEEIYREAVAETRRTYAARSGSRMSERGAEQEHDGGPSAEQPPSEEELRARARGADRRSGSRT